LRSTVILFDETAYQSWLGSYGVAVKPEDLQSLKEKEEEGRGKSETL
jgi:hypothetical protein